MSDIPPDVEAAFNAYPEQIRHKLLFLRQLILETALEISGIGELEETLKWSEPSYLSSHGSTVRIAWKAAMPDQYGIYFNCNTTLVETFKEVYPDEFSFSGNRGIIFNVDDDIPVEALKHCIALTLEYHRLKKRPMLGV